MQGIKPAGQERRRHARQPSTDFPIRCAKGGQEVREAHCLRDIGQGGLRFISSELYLPGEVVTIEFPALDEDTGLRGEVLWSGQDAADTHRYATGIRFLQPQLLLKGRIMGKVAEIESRRTKAPPVKS